MQRTSGVAVALALVIGTSFAVTACGESQTQEESPATVAVESQTQEESPATVAVESQTSAATLPVVTVYKSPT